MRLAITSLVLPLVIACQAPVPSAPTYFADVQPILSAHCSRCHGADPYKPEVAGFRLDRYVKDDSVSYDAFDYQDSIVLHSVQGEAPVMPPDYPLSERQQEILRKWVANKAPKGTRDNHKPKLEVLAPASPPSTVDQSLDVSIRTTDDDGDGLVVTLLARDTTTGATDTLAERLGGGLRQVTLDTGLVVSKTTVDVYALVDDGFFDDPAKNGTEVPLFSSVYVDHGDRGTAPRVSLLQPNGNETLIGQTQIAWSASDPDVGDVLTIDLDLVEVKQDGTQTVVSRLAQGLPSEPAIFNWNTAGVPTKDASGASILYLIKVTATDAGAKNTRSDVSDAPFTIAEVTTTSYTWADAKPIFVTYCVECHGQPARSPALEYFRLDKYDAADTEAPANSDTGVYENRSQVYQRMVVAKTMPPNASPQPSAAQLALVGNWIQGGAPFGSGPSDPKPNFTWTTPNNTAITKTTTGNVTLRWSASDAQGPLTGGSIEFVKITASSDQNAKCTTSLTGWATVTGSNVTAGSFGWTAPSLGYFCFRGTAVDSASQVTTAVAAKPVKYSTTPGP